MATETPFEPFAPLPVDAPAEDEAALAVAYAQAVAELNRLRDKASVDDNTTGNTAAYSMHDVSGVGRYVIPRRTGWRALVDIIHDPVPNIDFSANIYPAFDGIVGDHFQSPHFLDPLDDKYEARSYLSLHPGRRPYEDLRDNVAAVRNFLLQAYYADTPEGMTPEKARNALAEIAAFVGDGLYNNWLFLNIVPNHKPGEPFIDLSRAQAPHGQGAQYIYEKILEHQRHSTWMRPFAAVAALFGGKSQPDWKLPPASETHFTDYNGKDIVTEGAPPEGIDAASIAAAAANVAAIEARLTNLRDSRALTHTAIDLDALGNQLLYTVQNMQGVAHISEPVRRDAVTIARDILRKLKLSMGDLNVMDGLKLKPTDDLAVLGAVKGVSMVYERLLAWARGNNDAAIFQHPSILAATQAIGQLGYVAKLEARRMAVMAGNSRMASSITEQIKRLPTSYTQLSDARFGVLLDTVEHGIDTIINRIQEVSVSGAKIGKSVDNRGTSMDAAPTAGIGNQLGITQEMQRDMQLLSAEQLVANTRAQANNQQAQQTQSTTQQARTGGGTSPLGRQQSAQVTRAQRQSSTTSSIATVNPALLNDAHRKAATFNAFRASHAHDHDDEHHHQEEMLRRQAALLAQQKATASLAKAKAAASKIPLDTLKGFKTGMDMKGVTGAPITSGRAVDPKHVMKPHPKTTVAAPATTQTTPTHDSNATQDDPTKPHPATQHPTPPHGRGR